MKKITILFIIGFFTISVQGQNKIDSDEIITQISNAESSLKIENFTIVDELNFTNVGNLIEGKTSKSTTIIRENKHRSDTIIRYSQKNLALIDTDLEFISCVFEESIDAKKRMGNEKLTSRINTQFNGSLTFKDCLFKENVDLSSVKFEGDLVFLNCVFEELASLSGIRSKEKFIFRQCTFNNRCDFNNMLISKKAVLDQCNFKQDFSLANTIFSVEPDIVSSEFQVIKLRNCRIIDQPFFWYFEDDKKYEALLSKVKYDKSFYGTKFEHHKKMSIYTSRSNWGGERHNGKNIKTMGCKS